MKKIDSKSESPTKSSDFSILKVFKECFNKSRILGERISLLPPIIAPVYLGIRKVITQERMIIEQQKVF